jgi:hypothetical protein
MRTLAIVLGGVAVGGLAALLAFGPTPQAQQARPAVADSLTAPIISDTGALEGPRQPIFFRHDIHAGQFKIQCQYCHYSVAVSPEPGIPTMQTCMGCHLVVSGGDSASKTEIQKVRHIKALGPNACATCHGDLTRMPQVHKVNQVDRMGFCISCHLERDVSRDCSVCHY